MSKSLLSPFVQLIWDGFPAIEALQPAWNKSSLLVRNRPSIQRIPSITAFILWAVSAAPAERSLRHEQLLWLFSGRAGWQQQRNAAQHVLCSLPDLWMHSGLVGLYYCLWIRSAGLKTLPLPSHLWQRCIYRRRKSLFLKKQLTREWFLERAWILEMSSVV